ncbi:MAG: hypothetical protein HYZ14_12770 [Bacteroidetes bacterium]|nr:hypothetical protein [Bacteroidota bacterium]
MQSICLFEAGGTKTTLLIDRNGQVDRFELPGFNPNRYTPHFEQQLQKINLPASAQLIFYGSGLASDANKEIVRSVLQQKTTGGVSVYDDQLGAARAVFGDSAGLVGILGTGAFAAWYDGEQLHDRKGGHGYLIDDIGGGFELGKVILSAWLNNDLSPEMDNAVSAFVKTPKADFTTVFYKNPDLAMVAALAKLLIPFTTNPEIQQLLVRYFAMFFDRHVAPILIKHPTAQLGLVGGVAIGFEKVIRLSAYQSGIKEIVLVENPAQKLLEYHRRKGFK